MISISKHVYKCKTTQHIAAAVHGHDRGHGIHNALMYTSPTHAHTKIEP